MKKPAKNLYLNVPSEILKNYYQLKFRVGTETLRKYTFISFAIVNHFISEIQLSGVYIAFSSDLNV